MSGVGHDVNVRIAATFRKPAGCNEGVGAVIAEASQDYDGGAGLCTLRSSSSLHGLCDSAASEFNKDDRSDAVTRTREGVDAPSHVLLPHGDKDQILTRHRHWGHHFK